MVNEELSELHHEMPNEPVQAQCKTTTSHRDYVNLSWTHNGGKTSVHVCDNEQDEDVSCINCNQEETSSLSNTQVCYHL